MHGVSSAIEAPFPIFTQRAEPDIFFRLIGFFVTIIATTALRHADVESAGGSIDAAVISGTFHEGFAQHRGDMISSLPIGHDVGAHTREDVTSEVEDADPRQDEEAGVVDHQREVFDAQIEHPSDGGIMRGESPGGGEAEQREPLSVAVGVRI